MQGYTLIKCQLQMYQTKDKKKLKAKKKVKKIKPTKKQTHPTKTQIKHTKETKAK